MFRLCLVPLVLASTALSACAPVILGGAASAAYVGLQDRPVAQTAGDIQIKLNVKDHLTKLNFAYLTDIGIDVYYGDVLLTGIVPDRTAGEQVLDVVRRTPGVKKVYNELFVGSRYTVRQKAADAWVATQLQPRLLGAENAFPINYLMSVVNGHVYIIGSVGGAQEHNHVLHILSTTRGVKEVHDYLTVANPEDKTEPGAPASTQGTLKLGGATYRTTSPDPLSDAEMK